MLVQLLRLIDSARGALATHEAARRLGVGQELVEQMITDLVRLGYLQAATPGCPAGACHSCSQAAACSLRGHTRTWTLTARGRRLAMEG